MRRARPDQFDHETRPELQRRPFFSDEFKLQSGTFPVEFSYRSKPNTLGAPFIQRGGMFSHDMEGMAKFTEFEDQIMICFKFQTFDRSEGSEGRRSATIKGEAVRSFRSDSLS